MRLDRIVFVLFLCGGICASEKEAPAGKAERKFQFTYQAAIKSVPEGASAVELWLPVPQNSKHQEISDLSFRTERGGAAVKLKPAINSDPVLGNKMAYWKLTPEQAAGLSVTLSFTCARKEIAARDTSKARPLTADEAADLESHLKANRLVLVGGSFVATADLATKGATAPYEMARAAYDYTVSSMKYDKPKEKNGWGNGSTAWACDERFGNCTDFHALIMSIGRTKGIPVKFEMGFPLPERSGGFSSSVAVGGYHCWAKFYLGGVGWLPVDASEAWKHPELKNYYFGNLTPDRVHFTNGRDVNLVPKQAGEPLNFFIYPYAEAGGKPLAVEKAFSFKDVE